MEFKIIMRLLFVVVLLLFVAWYNVKYQQNIIANEAIAKKAIYQANKIKSASASAAQRQSASNRTYVVLNETLPLYSSEENTLRESAITWAEFLDVGLATPRSLSYVPSALQAIKSLHQCSPKLESNLTSKLSNADRSWCFWAISETGGKVRVGESFGILSATEQAKFDYLRCDKIVLNYNPSCDEGWGEAFIKNWKRNIVTGLCEEKAPSKVKCYDSAFYGVRFCDFSNAMMNFKKMRKRPSSKPNPLGTTTSRLWERGFLSTDCGFEAKENIGYLQIYKPDIDGSSDAICDYVFNETVIAYSHDNIKSLGHMISDYLNIWTMLWLTGVGRFAKDITFLNIDGIRNGVHNDDMPTQYFSHYEKTFRRVIRAAAFGPDSTVCFKRLIMQPKPQIPFIKDGWTSDSRCSFVGPSSVFQRWNINIRANYQLLQKVPSSDQKLSILLITRSVKVSGGTSTAHLDTLGRSHRYLEDSSIASVGSSSRVIANELALIDALTTYAKGHNANLVVQEFARIPFSRQMELISEAGIVIGMHGSGIAAAAHMAIGSQLCCGVIEIFPDGEFKKVRGFGNMIRRTGAYYTRLDITGNETTSTGTIVPVPTLLVSLQNIQDSIVAAPSCVLPSVVRSLYL